MNAIVCLIVAGSCHDSSLYHFAESLFGLGGVRASLGPEALKWAPLSASQELGCDIAFFFFLFECVQVFLALDTIDA